MDERSERVETRLDGVETRLGKVETRQQRFQDQMAEVRGSVTEDRMRDLLWKLLPEQGLRPLGPIRTIHLNGWWEIDGVVQVEAADGERFWVIAEAKAKLFVSDIQRFAERLQQRKVRSALQKMGITGRIQPWIFALGLTPGCEDKAEQAGVGLVEPRSGILVSPREWTF